MDFLSVVEDTRSVGGNSGEEAEHIATSTRTSSRCKEGSTDKLNMSQGYPTESCNGEISQDEHEQHISNDNYSKSKACKDEGEDALMLQCDEDINGCDWSPPLPVQLVEDNSSNQLHEQEQGKENEEESNQELAAKEDEKGDLKATSSSEEDLITTNNNNNSNSLQVVVEECTKDLQKKEHPLYALRRNPKRSRRFIDQEYALDSSAPAAGAAAAAATPKKSTTSIFTEKARACTECGKEFLSWKALFGHMRCHPEREWRGIQRPDNLSDYKFPKPGGGAVRRSNKKPRQAPVPTPLLLDDDQDEELEAMYIKVIASDNESDTESIEAVYINGGCNSSGGFNSKGKIITGKRSKRSRQQQTVSRSSLQEFVAASTTATDTTPAEIKEERDMARCLVMLACAGRMSSSSLGFEDEEEEGTSTTNHIAHKYNGVASGSSNGMEEDFEDEEVTGLNNEGELEQEEDEQQDDLHHFHQAVQHATGLKECMGINNVSLLCANGELLDHDFDGTRMKYECSTCKRIFKSHQALGGHRASHKKVKGCFAKTNLSNTDGIQQHQQQESAEEDITDEEFLRSDEQLLPLDLNDHHLHHHHHHHSILPIIPSSTILAAAQSHPHHHAFDTATGISNSFKVKDEVGDTNFSSRKISIKGHECSICHRVFTSGQALGGHKRCHWGGTERTGPENLISSKPGSSMHLAQVVALAAAEAGVTGGLLSNNSRTVTSTKEELLDLNLPALVEDECEDEDDAKDDNDHSKKNTMDAMYKLPQPVSSCALKKNSGAFSGLIEVMNSHNSHQDLP